MAFASRPFEMASPRLTTVVVALGAAFAFLVGPNRLELPEPAHDAASLAGQTYAYDSVPTLAPSPLNTRIDERHVERDLSAVGRASTRSDSPRLAAKAVRGVDQGFAVGAGFRSFSQAKRVLGPAGEGKQWHHLVEQTPGNVGRFGPEAIHNTGNLVRLDTAVHRQVSGYFSSKQPFTGGQTVRQWLSGQSYARQQQFARQVMERFGG